MQDFSQKIYEIIIIFLFFKPMFPLPIAFSDFGRFFIRIVHMHHEEVGECHL